MNLGCELLQNWMSKNEMFSLMEKYKKNRKENEIALAKLCRGKKKNDKIIHNTNHTLRCTNLHF